MGNICEDCFNKSKPVQWNQCDSQEGFQIHHEPAYILGEEDGEKEFSSTIPSRQGNAQRPEVHRVIWNNDELTTDALLVHSFEHYMAKDYSLAHALFTGSNYAGGQWKSWGVERILSGKAGELKEYLVDLLHAESVKFEGHGQIQEALAAYINALLLDPGYVLCRILIGALLLKMGSKAFPAARNLLSDALRMEPTNQMAWYYLGMAHKDDGRITDATDRFQAVSNLEESNPLIPPRSHACTYPVAWPLLVT